jgi:hypothetical protein
MSVDFRHPLHVRHAPDWCLVDDVCDGRNLREYLIPINPSDTSAENAVRNEQLFNRAVFYAVAGYTVRGLIGLVFQHWPKLDVPAALDYVAEDIDGADVSIYQQSQSVVRELVRKGRCGLLVNLLSPSERPASVNDKTRAVVQLFKAEDIINWRFERVGTDYKLTLVVLRYQKEVYRDGFKIEYRDALLELRLEGGKYVIRSWEKQGGDWQKVSEVVPHDATGKPLAEIPFTFVGSETNTPSEAVTQCLNWVAMFNGASGSIEYTVSQDFVDPCDAQMLQQVVSAFVTRALPIDDYLRAMQRHKLVDSEKTVEQFREDVDGGPLFVE